MKSAMTPEGAEMLLQHNQRLTEQNEYLRKALGTLQRAAHALAAWSESHNALEPGTVPPEVINECQEMERIASSALTPQEGAK